MGGQVSKDATAAGGWLALYMPACLLPATPAAESNEEPRSVAPTTATEAANPPPPASLLLRALWRRTQEQQQEPKQQEAGTVSNHAPAVTDQAPSPRPAAIDPADLVLKGLVGQTVIKGPGAWAGGEPQPFSIEGCVDCDIYLLDATAQVSVDDCVGCRLVLGPCAGSLFLRDCARCGVVAACQQFRTRGCEDLDVWLFAATAPSIESSHDIRLGCYSYAYEGLAAQFAAAGLDPRGANRLREVYDFTPAEHKDKAPHFALVPEWASHAGTIKPLPPDLAARIGYSEDPARRPVPPTPS